MPEVNSRARVVVLGASGFIGRRVMAALAVTDWAQPIGASRRAPPTASGADGNWITLDATDESALRRALVGTTAVVNCVAGDARTIVASARACFAAAASAPATRVVHLSSLAAYGSATGMLDETAALLGDLGPYSAAKAAAEQLAARAADCVVLRPGIVYGAHSPWWSDRIARLLVARRLGDLGSRGLGRCNLVFVDDAAAAIVSALRLPGAGVRAFNLSAPEPPTWNEYFHRYAKALGALPLRPMSPLRLGLELAVAAPSLKLLETVGRLLHQREPDAIPPIRPWLLELCRHDIELDSRKAERFLGMRWTPLDRGLQKTAAWFAAAQRN